MPYDKATLGHIAEEEEEEAAKSGANLGAKRRFDEFECPTCSANNPYDDFGHDDEVHCAWCGLAFVAIVDEDGKLKLKEP